MGDWPLIGLVAALVGPAGVILLLGPALSRYADAIGKEIGLAKTLVGALLLGATTSLPGIVASVTAALHGLPELAASNAVGGIAAQTMFLAVADLFYRRANLEHDAASIGNLVQSALLLVVLTIPLVAALCPIAATWPVHPATAVLTLVYIGGLQAVRSSSDRPMWLPRGGQVDGVDEEVAADLLPRGRKRLVWATLGCALGVAVSGWVLTLAAEVIAARYQLAEAAVGALGTAIVTSLPELVTTIAAVRRGALSIAVGGVMGGNAFDVLFLAAADVAYLDGSIYHGAGAAVWFQLALTCTMVGILLLGLSMRQRRGPGNIGFESVAVLGCYLLGVVAIIVWPQPPA
jgi:cation:H+ antiporter